MKAMVLNRVVSLDDVETPLELVDLPLPRPSGHEVLIKVTACGVCHLPVYDSLRARSTFFKTGNRLCGHGIAISSPLRCRSVEPEPSKNKWGLG